MFEKVVKYTDYNNNVREETLRFNMSEAEWLELSFSEKGGLESVLNKMLEEQDNVQLAKYFKEILLASYGEKSGDGRSFIKRATDGHKLCYDFEQTGAYNEMFMWLLSGTEAVTEFFNGIVPKDKKVEGNDRNLRAVQEAKEAARARLNNADMEVVK